MIEHLPLVNATLNSCCTALLLAGLVAVKTGRVPLHKACMGGAVVLSALFLVSYLVYHAKHGATPFAGTGWIRPAYYAMLWTHMACAAAVVPLVLVTLRHALRDRIDRHRRIARWTLPIWLYVSVTGVLVYLFLHRWFRA